MLRVEIRDNESRGYNARLTGADESLSVYTQGNISDEDGASNSSETGAPAMIYWALASILQCQTFSYCLEELAMDEEDLDRNAYMI